MRLLLSKLFFLTLLLFSITETAKASHIMGGEITYLYLGKFGTSFRYKIKLNIYSNCDTNTASSVYWNGITDPITISIYYASDGSLYTNITDYATISDITPT